MAYSLGFILALAAVAVVQASPIGNDLLRQRRAIINKEDPEVNMNTEQIIEYYGYPFESYTVKTEDKYTLTVHRIPHSRNVPETPTKPRPVVFLQHGFDGSSADWITNLPNQAAAYVFADAGFDVFLGNFRGNLESKSQEGWTDKHAYWQFSWDEMAAYDLPAMINLALNVSGADSLYYVAHSIGTTAGFAKFSDDPVFAQKIKKFYALGPIAYMKHAKGPLHYIAKLTGALQWLLGIIGVDEFAPNQWFMKEMAKYVCSNVITDLLCEDVLFLIGGPDSKQLNATRVPVYITHSPGGTSSRDVIHFGQLIQSGKFQHYDYGSAKKNQEHYQQKTPPEYDVTKMQVPVVVYSGDMDWLADPEDVAQLIPQLHSLEHHIALQGYNHFDFIWGLRAAPQIYFPIMNEIKAAHKAQMKQ